MECRRCGYKATRKWYLQCHLRRQRPCVPITVSRDIPRESLLRDLENIMDTHTCSRCDAVFGSHAGLNRHSKKCVATDQRVATLEKRLAELEMKLAETPKVAPASAPVMVSNSLKGMNVGGTNNTAINTEVYNVSDFLNFKEEVVKQFLGHISDEKVIEYIRAEPRQAILDIFQDVFFNIKKKRNMVLAVKDLDPLTVYLHQNRAWQQEDPAVLVELMSAVMLDFRGRIDRSEQKEDLGKLANLNHLNGTYTGMRGELAQTAFDHTYKAVAAVGPLPD